MNAIEARAHHYFILAFFYSSEKLQTLELLYCPKVRQSEHSIDQHLSQS